MIFVKPLTDQEIKNEIVSAVKTLLPEAKVVLFGSRAKNTAKPESDYDIVLIWKEKIPAYLLFELEELLDRLPTLKIIDLMDYANLSQDFKQIVNSEGQVLYAG